MFRKREQLIGNLLDGFMQESGLATPLLQRRLLQAWDALPVFSHYTVDRSIRNQTLFVKISNPAMRADLSMMRSELVQRLNSQVGAFVISDIRIY